MKDKILTILFLVLIVSCGTYRETKHGYKIKGNTEIIFNGTDENLNGKSLITGFVYSRDTKDFPEKAEVLIGGQKTWTDKNGFFSLIIEPGIYNISTNYIGNNEEKLDRFELKKNKRVIILFELGTSTLY